MRLKLFNESLAETYGLPLQDGDSNTIIRGLVAQGWKESEAQAHLDAALHAGAYLVEDQPIEKKQKKDTLGGRDA